MRIILANPRGFCAGVVLLLACLLLGVLLRRSGKLPENAPTMINGFIIHVSLPALVLEYIHNAEPRLELIGAVLMPWLLFILGAAVFWLLGWTLQMSRSTTGALILLGGLGNTSFIGLPMIESFYGASYLSTGILIDQLGTYLVLSTLGIAVACIYSEASASRREIAWRIATFPPLIAMVSALVLLNRVGGIMAPLALVSVGLQLRMAMLANNRAALAAARGRCAARAGCRRRCGRPPWFGLRAAVIGMSASACCAAMISSAPRRRVSNWVSADN